MTDSITIRDERPDDVADIRRVIVDAFSQGEFGYHGEADLVDQIRGNRHECLSIVACSGDSVIGHALFSPVQLRCGGQSVDGMGLAPMSVESQYQRQGVGTRLMNHGLEKLRQSGCEFVVVLGHPEYYRRFGFDLAERDGIKHGFAGIPQEVFFVQWMSPDIRPMPGRLYYCPEFGPQF